jgi:uncharacterized protein
MALIFDWDTNKAQTNSIKHGVTFEEASTLFADENSITIDDPSHSLHEKRSVTIGLSAKKKLLVAVHTERGGKIRIISARLASQKEKRLYEI